MRVFMTKQFARFARRERIADATLIGAVRRAEHGLVDADFGGGIVKQRAARVGHGRSGGYRVLLAYRRKTRAVFLFGFAKSERDNIDDGELATLRDIAKGWLQADDRALMGAVTNGLIVEVTYAED